MVGQVVEAMDRLVGMGDGRRWLRCGGLASRTTGVLISIVVVQSICTPQIVFNVGDGGGEVHGAGRVLFSVNWGQKDPKS